MYYLLEDDPFQKPAPYRTSAILDDEDDYRFDPARWIAGKLLAEPKHPIKVEFWGKGERGFPEICLDSIPLFTEPFIQALYEAGVDNLQLKPVETVEREGAEVTEAYKAVNILGLVKCADLEKSSYTDTTGTGMIAVSFRKLVIDEEKANGLLFFRLAESVSDIIIHQSVKDILDKKKFKYLSFRALSE